VTSNGVLVPYRTTPTHFALRFRLPEEVIPLEVDIAKKPSEGGLEPCTSNLEQTTCSDGLQFTGDNPTFMFFFSDQSEPIIPPISVGRAPIPSPGETLDLADTGLPDNFRTQLPFPPVFEKGPVGDESFTFALGFFFPGTQTFDPANTDFFIGKSDFSGFAIPEPSTWSLFLLGFAALAWAGYKRSRKPSRWIEAA
jgi:PEP-CTERM motif